MGGGHSPGRLDSRRDEKTTGSRHGADGSASANSSGRAGLMTFREPGALVRSIIGMTVPGSNLTLTDAPPSGRLHRRNLDRVFSPVGMNHAKSLDGSRGSRRQVAAKKLAGNGR